tara:strand:- start:271 stop:504 length:234 start_codon:yes stop_codon:yes gene_type:complete
MEIQRNIEIRALTPALGAEVSGIDLTGSLSCKDVRALEQEWMEHLVLFFPDQPLNINQLTAFGERFGALHIHPPGDI